MATALAALTLRGPVLPSWALVGWGSAVPLSLLLQPGSPGGLKAPHPLTAPAGQSQLRDIPLDNNQYQLIYTASFPLYKWYSLNSHIAHLIDERLRSKGATVLAQHHGSCSNPGFLAPEPHRIVQNNG